MDKKPMILLVEDDEELASVYRARFEAEGFATAWAENGELALARVTESQPDLILLDIMMPRVSGFDVLDILRNTPQTQHAKIVMMSALSSDKDIAKAKSLGVDDYLVKSQVAMADVVHIVKKHLGMLDDGSRPAQAAGDMPADASMTPPSPPPVEPTSTT
ncbi:MAG: response regulator [Candidatus Saccharibacteria bacterium]